MEEHYVIPAKLKDGCENDSLTLMHICYLQHKNGCMHDEYVTPVFVQCTYSFEILSKMNEHFEPSDHAIFVLFQQQVALLHLGRHQLLVEVTLYTRQWHSL